MGSDKIPPPAYSRRISEQAFRFLPPGGLPAPERLFSLSRFRRSLPCSPQTSPILFPRPLQPGNNSPCTAPASFPQREALPWPPHSSQPPSWCKCGETALSAVSTASRPAPPKAVSEDHCRGGLPWYNFHSERTDSSVQSRAPHYRDPLTGEYFRISEAWQHHSCRLPP